MSIMFACISTAETVAKFAYKGQYTSLPVQKALFRAGDFLTGRTTTGIMWLSPGGLTLARPSCSLMERPSCQPGGPLQVSGSLRPPGRVGWTPTWQLAPCAFLMVSTCTTCPNCCVLHEQFCGAHACLSPCTLQTCHNVANVLMAA